jgi:transposase
MAKPYRIHLTPEQGMELHELARQRVLAPAVRDRLEMVRLSDLGWSVPRIAQLLDKHEQTVRRYIKAFLASGWDALPDRPRPGRPPTLTEAHLRAVEQVLDESTTQGDRTWSAPQLARWLAETHGVRVRPKYLGERLRHRKFRWKRTKRSVHHKADPDRQEQARADLAALAL